MELPAGGDLFLLVASAARGTVTAINGSCTAPHHATLDHYLALGRIPEYGWLARGPWGPARGCDHLCRAGLSPDRPAGAQQAEMAAIAAEFSDTRAVFFPNGRPPAAGFVHCSRGERAKSLARHVDPPRAGALEPETAGHPDTTYLCVVDEALNVVSYP